MRIGTGSTPGAPLWSFTGPVRKSVTMDSCWKEEEDANDTEDEMKEDAEEEEEEEEDACWRRRTRATGSGIRTMS